MIGPVCSQVLFSFELRLAVHVDWFGLVRFFVHGSGSFVYLIGANLDEQARFLPGFSESFHERLGYVDPPRFFRILLAFLRSGDGCTVHDGVYFAYASEQLSNLLGFFQVELDGFTTRVFRSSRAEPRHHLVFSLQSFHQLPSQRAACTGHQDAHVVCLWSRCPSYHVSERRSPTPFPTPWRDAPPLCCATTTQRRHHTCTVRPIGSVVVDASRATTTRRAPEPPGLRHDDLFLRPSHHCRLRLVSSWAIGRPIHHVDASVPRRRASPAPILRDVLRTCPVS
mmetsp:Transcript_849/g.5293  ORF Transcript_849/g.5293 Transcript_849/m.5293 type:complete len:282 (-) Transcript_849:15-860(-)